MSILKSNRFGINREAKVAAYQLYQSLLAKSLNSQLFTSLEITPPDWVQAIFLIKKHESMYS